MKTLTNFLTYIVIVTFIALMVAFGFGSAGILAAQDEETTETTAGEETTAEETTAEDTGVQGDLMNFRMIIWNGSFALQIQPGDTVTWVNTDAKIHKIVSGTQEEPTSLFESTDLDTADTFDFTFEEEGVFFYYLEDTPLVTGTIVVGEPEMPAATEETTAAGETTAEETTAAGETTAEETTAAGETTAEETTAAGETTAETAEETTAAGETTAEEPSPMETVQITGDYAIAVYVDQFGLSIPQGSTVTFENKDTDARTIISGTPPDGDDVFNSGEPAQGDTFEFTFDESGVIRFFLQGMVESRSMVLVGDIAEVSAPGAVFEEDTGATTTTTATDTAETETTEAETTEAETTS